MTSAVGISVLHAFHATRPVLFSALPMLFIPRLRFAELFAVGRTGAPVHNTTCIRVDEHVARRVKAVALACETVPSPCSQTSSRGLSWLKLGAASSETAPVTIRWVL